MEALTETPRVKYNPYHPGVPGKCHVCKWNRLVKFCERCRHWMCKDCRNSITKRGWAAFKQFFSSTPPGCCGPKEN